ncbi:MAG: precorrin-4 C(11)-methyltransferase [Lachnospiraceae bacterium]|nr:precorrin-4 C(11)-methyltransferase [Lachnospiraceae bacterium]
MIHFVGAGPGAADLITVRGRQLIEKADVVIYAGSLVNPELLEYARTDAEILDSAVMTLEEVTEVMTAAHAEGKEVVRLHTGDASVFGAIREQMDLLDERGIPFDVCPGVTACFGAAASLQMEYTLPEVTQTLIITRLGGKTPVPDKERLRLLAEHQASMAIYLSAGMLDRLSEELLAGGYPPETPAALVYKATWREEKKVICTVETLAEAGRENGIDRLAVVLVGRAVDPQGNYERSMLYHPDFETMYRRPAGTSGE